MVTADRPDMEWAWGQYWELNLNTVHLKCPTDIQVGMLNGQLVVHTTLRFRGEVQAGDRNFVWRELVAVGIVYDLDT